MNAKAHTARAGSPRPRTAAKSDKVSKLRLRAWLHLLFAVQEIERELRQSLSDDFAETLPRLDVLAALSRTPEGLTMTGLSRSLRLSKGNITGLVGRLVRDGLVARKAKDGRSTLVTLTPRGRKLFSEMASSHEGWLNDLLKSLTASELQGLVETIAKLRRHLP